MKKTLVPTPMYSKLCFIPRKTASFLCSTPLIVGSTTIFHGASPQRRAKAQRRAEIRGVLHQAPQDLHGALAALLAAVLRNRWGNVEAAENLAGIHPETWEKCQKLGQT